MFDGNPESASLAKYIVLTELIGNAVISDALFNPVLSIYLYGILLFSASSRAFVLAYTVPLAPVLASITSVGVVPLPLLATMLAI